MPYKRDDWHDRSPMMNEIRRAFCDKVLSGFAAELRPSKTPILRQKNMRYERNAYDSFGRLTNPIFNIQDFEQGRFPEFRGAALNLLTSPAVQGAVAALLDAPTQAGSVKMIQSMFFEAPAGTWAHQDSYYQDSAGRLGGSVAGWFALED